MTMARIRFLNPCPGYSLTVPGGVFGAPRTGHLHAGWDFTAPKGSPVRATASGRVSKVGLTDIGDAGLYVELAIGSGWSWFGCHLSKVLVAPGDVVRYGQIIGLVGDTGNAAGFHLHAAWYLFGRPVDPATIVEADTGPNVALLQARLAAHGFDPGGLDGRFGPKTAAALAAFQGSVLLDPTGVEDEWTTQRLARKAGGLG